MDEKRRERKIMMVLKDANVEQYIQMNMTEIDINDEEVVKEQPLEVQIAIQDKLDFRSHFAQTLFITRLNYIFRVLRQQYGRKATIADPEAFKDKIKAIERRERRAARMAGFGRQDSSRSAFSSFSKGLKTGMTQSEMDNSLKDEMSADEEDADAETQGTSGDSANMIIAGLGTIFSEMEKDLKAKGKSRLAAMEKKYAEDEEEESSCIDGETPYK